MGLEAVKALLAARTGDSLTWSGDGVTYACTTPNVRSFGRRTRGVIDRSVAFRRQWPSIAKDTGRRIYKVRVRNTPHVKCSVFGGGEVKLQTGLPTRVNFGDATAVELDFEKSTPAGDTTIRCPDNAAHFHRCAESRNNNDAPLLVVLGWDAQNLALVASPGRV